MALENFAISRRHLVVIIQPSTVLIVVTMAFGDIRSCYCDEICKGIGDCCVDYDEW